MPPHPGCMGPRASRSPARKRRPLFGKFVYIELLGGRASAWPRFDAGRANENGCDIPILTDVGAEGFPLRTARAVFKASHD